MQPRDIVLSLPFFVVLYFVVRSILRSGRTKSGRTVDTVLPVAMIVIGCAIWALRAVS